MSLARDITAAGQNATAPFEEEEVQSLSATDPFTFRAKIQPIVDIELNSELGRDARESDLFHVRDRAAAARIQKLDVLTALGDKFRVLRRTLNPATLHAEFGCMKLVPGKDA